MQPSPLAQITTVQTIHMTKKGAVIVLVGYSKSGEMTLPMSLHRSTNNWINHSEKQASDWCSYLRNDVPGLLILQYGSQLLQYPPYYLRCNP